MGKALYTTVQTDPRAKWHLAKADDSTSICGIHYTEEVIGGDVLLIADGLVTICHVGTFGHYKNLHTVPIGSYCKRCGAIATKPITHKMILDPDADGDQWIYRGCFVQRQNFRNLLKYCCFDENWHTLGSTDYQKNARQIIDNHLKQRESQP